MVRVWPAAITVPASTVVVTLGRVTTVALSWVTATAPPEELDEVESASLFDTALIDTLRLALMVPPAPALTVGSALTCTVALVTETAPPPLASEPAVASSDAVAATVTSRAMVSALVPMTLPREKASVVEVMFALGVLDPADRPTPTPKLLTLASAWLSAMADTETVPSSARTVAPDSIAAVVVLASVVATESVDRAIAATAPLDATPLP